MKKTLIAWAASTLLGFGAVNAALAADPNPSDWDAVKAQAKGQTVFFNAWGGSQNINDYITWAGNQLK